jgi:hypothetical protein
MTNDPPNYASYQTNDLRGIEFTKWSRIDAQTKELTEKPNNYMAPYFLIKKISQFIFLAVEDILVLYPTIQDKKKITHFFPEKIYSRHISSLQFKLYSHQQNHDSTTYISFY